MEKMGIMIINTEQSVTACNIPHTVRSLNCLDEKGSNIMAALHITNENFDQEVLHSDKPVLLDFWASWCGPCQMIAPVIEQISEEVSDAKIGKVNVDEQPELAQQFQIMNIPTLVVMKNGKLVNKAIGIAGKDEILEMLKAE